METERADGIVLRRQPVTESSLIVTWYSREFGKLKTMAKGARRSKSPFQGKLDLFYEDELVFLRSQRSELHLLHDCYLVKPHVALRTSAIRLAAASYVCELVELATAVEDKNLAVFDLLTQMLTEVEQDSSEASRIWFELQLLSVTGWARRWDAHTGIDRVLRSLAGATLAGARRVRLNASQTAACRECLNRIWDAELGHALRSRPWLPGENKR